MIEEEDFWSDKEEDFNYEKYEGKDHHSGYEDAYHEGWDAFHKNKDENANPYEKETKKYRGWKDGWNSAEDEFFDHDFDNY